MATSLNIVPVNIHQGEGSIVTIVIVVHQGEVSIATIVIDVRQAERCRGTNCNRNLNMEARNMRAFSVNLILVHLEIWYMSLGDDAGMPSTTTRSHSARPS